MVSKNKCLMNYITIINYISIINIINSSFLLLKTEIDFLKFFIFVNLRPQTQYKETIIYIIITKISHDYYT